jgi:PAS domain S-box-containing protein
MKQECQEEALYAVVDAIPHFVWMMHPDGTFEYSNQRMRDYVDRTTDQLQGNGWIQILHPEDHERTLALRQHSLETGDPYENEYRFQNGQTGAYRWFLARAMPVRDEAGQIVKWFATATDVDEQKRTEEVLRQSQERASVLMNSNMIGIIVIEGEQIVDANDTFLRMTGYTREDLHAGRMNVMHMTTPEYLACTQQVLTTQQQITYEKEYVCKDGSRLSVLVCGVPLQQHPFQGIAFVLDNSARKELEQRKDDFLSMASHELKTPLTSLKLQIQLVKKRLEQQDLHDAAEALSRVEKPIGQLDRLITELLDVSKIQAGRLEFFQETINLDALLHNVVETMEQMNGAHTIVVHGAASLSLVGDKDRLEQVFINLLSNAIKYSPDAPLIEMDVSTSTETVTISVRDHGMGIPKEQHEKIFERFYRAFDPSQRAVPGVGMGLYIVAEIVKQYGGRITVESEVGKGSTFSVMLPLKEPILLHGDPIRE